MVGLSELVSHVWHFLLDFMVSVSAGLTHGTGRFHGFSMISCLPMTFASPGRETTRIGFSALAGVHARSGKLRTSMLREWSQPPTETQAWTSVLKGAYPRPQKTHLPQPRSSPPHCSPALGPLPTPPQPSCPPAMPQT